MRRIINACLMILAVTLGAVGPAKAQTGPRVLVMGDSMLAAHRISGRAVSHALGRYLGVPVTDQSVMGARIIYRLPISGALGMNIGQQYRVGKWDWIVLNGGGNDLWLGCGCTKCQRRMDQLITPHGDRGEIPKLLVKLRKTGARVIYVGYLRSPGVGSPIEHCRDEGDALEARIAGLVARMPGVEFVSLADLVPHGDRSYHGADMIHPSLKASREIAERIARTIKTAR